MAVKLTPEEIDALEPGEALDRLVAEYVMGKPKPGITHEPDHLGAIDAGSWYCLPDYFRGDICEWTPHAFSSDMRYAWMVVMQFDEYKLFGMTDNHAHSCRLRSFRDEKSLFGESWGATPALAICRAALRAAME